MSRMAINKVYTQFSKPVLDWLIALVLVILASPIVFLAIVFLLIFNDGKVWFIQLRPGKNEKIFTLIKFKTMNEKRDDKGALLSDAERLTKMGSFIRRTSLDELPQLFNVLKGDMSIVGPRPLLIEYLPLYDDTQKQRHQVKPGITGWAQVNGRNSIDWQTKFNFDVWYVAHQSFWLDLKILFLTLIKVVKSEGIASSTSATMDRFTGMGK
jgi:undecaprenyl phosphate N,N'-diacetylbacillosamine 1-phosphate transferase